LIGELRIEFSFRFSTEGVTSSMYAYHCFVLAGIGSVAYSGFEDL